MGLVSLYIATSLDGKIAGAHDELDWLPASGGEDYGYAEYLATVRVVVMGSKTYEVARSLGPWPYGDRPTYVVTKGEPERATSSVSFLRNDVAASVRNFSKETKGRVWVVGGAQLAGHLLDCGVIDEMIVTVIPVVLGEGIGLFDHVEGHRHLRLEGLQRWKTGVVQLTYTVEK